MKWLAMGVCLLIAVVAAFVMPLAAADPEGRGGDIALTAFVVVAACVIAIIGIGIFWP